MEIKDMNLEEIEARKAEISEKLAAASVDELKEFETELDALEARAAEIAEQAEKRAALEQRVIVEGRKIESFEELEEITERKDEQKMEVRNTAEYIEAYANYIKTDKDAECRALLTEDATAATGYVPVPDFVDDIVRTAWEREGIMNRVRKSYLKGNIRVGFELSADGAVIHNEGAAAPNEETLTLGIVELVPKSIKKWITISDEVMDLKGEAFLRYIYDEVTYQIAKKAAEELIGKIVDSPAASNDSAVGVASVTASTIAPATVATAMGALSGEAANLCIVMNRATEAAFKAVQYDGNYAVDIFEGLPREYTTALKSFAEAESGEAYAIIGDFDRGALANFPAGEGVQFKFDELSLAEKDLVKIVGREFVGLGIVGPGCFVKIVK